MRFEWDDRKAEQNLRKHKVGFKEAELVFGDPLAISIPDVGHSENENRWITLGLAGGGGPLVIVIHVYRNREEEEIIRIISARKANSKERRQYTNLPGYQL